jgi:hypothetical protein
MTRKLEMKGQNILNLENGFFFRCKNNPREYCSRDCFAFSVVDNHVLCLDFSGKENAITAGILVKEVK